MKNQIEIVKAIAESMEGIGGVPTNADFYKEFNFRLKEALKIPFVVGQSDQLVCDYKYHNRDITTNGECTKCESNKWR